MCNSKGFLHLCVPLLCPQKLVDGSCCICKCWAGTEGPLLLWEPISPAGNAMTSCADHGRSDTSQWCSWGPIFPVRTAACLFCREDDGVKDEDVICEQVKYLTNSVPFGKGMIWYAYELKKENFPALKKKKDTSSQNTIVSWFFPGGESSISNYMQISSWIFSVSTSYALPQTPVHSLCCHIQQVETNQIPVKHVLLFLFLL